MYSAELIHIGKERCLLAAIEDITKRKRIEQSLLRSEAFLAEGQRLSHTGSWSWTVSSGEVFCSRETFRIFELDPNTRRPTPEILRRYLHGDDEALFERAVNSLRRDPQDCQGDLRIILADGAVKHIHWVARPVCDATGKLIEFVGTAMDVTERKKTEEELRQLSGQILRLHDAERRSISRDLHDVTGQGLVALEATLGQLHEQLPSSNRTGRKLLSEAMTLAMDCLREVRSLSYVLYPPMLEHSGLADAIRHFRDGFVKRTGIQVNLRISPGFERLPPETELALFRVAQESLANIQRHSRSRDAEILLERRDGFAVLEVRDHGRGIPAENRKTDGELSFAGGVGIASMQERVKQVGGRLEIRSSGCGTNVSAAVPVYA